MLPSFYGSLTANTEESSPRSMERHVPKKFTWVINNFSSLQSVKIYSDRFSVGGCKWHLMVYKGKIKHNNLSLFLEVADPESLPPGWKRHTKYSFTVVNPILENISILRESQHWFDEKSVAWGFQSMFSISELDPKISEFLVNGTLKIVAEVEVLEVIGKLDEPEESYEKGFMEVNGFQVLPSQVNSVNRLFERHPYIASELLIENQYLKTGYMNVLLSLTETLRQSPHKISHHDLADAYAALNPMSEAGFMLDWLEKKIDDMSEKKEKVEACETRVQELEEELKDLKLKCSDVEVLLEMKKAELLGARAPFSHDHIF